MTEEHSKVRGLVVRAMSSSSAPPPAPGRFPGLGVGRRRGVLLQHHHFSPLSFFFSFMHICTYFVQISEHFGFSSDNKILTIKCEFIVKLNAYIISPCSFEERNFCSAMNMNSM